MFRGRPLATGGPSHIEEKLDAIIAHLDRLNRRDRLRTFGGFFRSLLGLVPLVLMLGSLWYAYAHFDTLLEKIAGEAAKQAAAVTKVDAGGLMEQFKKMLPGR